MNTRRYPRSMREAFPFGPEYGCAIERPNTPRIDLAFWAAIAAGFVMVGLVFLGVV